MIIFLFFHNITGVCRIFAPGRQNSSIVYVELTSHLIIMPKHFFLDIVKDSAISSIGIEMVSILKVSLVEYSVLYRLCFLQYRPSLLTSASTNPVLQSTVQNQLYTTCNPCNFVHKQEVCGVHVR